MDSIGMGGRFAPESVDELDRNMHKVKLRNHITYSAPISQWDKKIVRKLDFMKATYSSLAKTGRTSSVYLASLDRVTQPINDAIRQNGYGCISIIGPDELESMIV